MNSKTSFYLIVVLTITAAILRLLYLNQGIWFDEIVTLVEFARKPFLQLISSYPSENQHTLYVILAKMFIFIFGEHTWTLRMPAVLFGSASIPLIYLLARKILSKQEGIAAAILLTFSYHHIWFSQNARGYTGLLFWTILGTYLFLIGLKRNSLKIWIIFALVSALGVYTHLTMAFVTISQFLVFLSWIYANRHKIRSENLNIKIPIIFGFVLAGIIGFLIFLPLLQDMLKHILIEKPRVNSQWTSIFWTIAEAFRVISSRTPAALPVIGLGAIIFVVGMVNIARRDIPTIGLLVLPGLLGLAVVMALSHNIWPRFFFYAVGFVLIILVRGIFSLSEMLSRLSIFSGKSNHIAWAAISFGVFFSLYSLQFVYLPKQNYSDALHKVEKMSSDSDIICTTGLTTYPFQKYYGKDWPEVESIEQIDQFRQQSSTIWVMVSFPIYMESRLPELWQFLQQNFVVAGRFFGSVGGGELLIFKSNFPPGE